MNKCKLCGKKVKRSGRKFCSYACRDESYRGKQNEQMRKLNLLQKMGKHPRWKGGKSITPLGYVIVLMPDHPNASVGGRYVFEHRIVMEKFLGRTLNRWEVVHHKNEIKTDNRIENLELLTKREHDRLHGIQVDMDYVRRCRAPKGECHGKGK